MSQKVKCCVFCAMTFQSQESLQEHFRKHANKTIDMKGQQVSTDPSQEKFIIGKPKDKSHITKDTIQCEGCSEVFNSITKAIQHKYRKHPELPSKNYCYYCGMLFPLQCTLNTHLLKHDTNFIPEPNEIWPCTECEAIFYNREALLYHSSSTHKRNHALLQPTATAPPSKKIKVNNANEALSAYYCHLCGTEYIVKFNLQKHLERQHTKAERESLPVCLIKCTTCEAIFYNKKAYDIHNIYHKPDDLYVTSEAQRLQTVARVDQDFDLTRVQKFADKYLATRKKWVSKSVSAKINPPLAGCFKSSSSDSELSPASVINSSDEECQHNTRNKLMAYTDCKIKAKTKIRVKELSKLTNIKRTCTRNVDAGDIKMIKRKGKILVVRKINKNTDSPIQPLKKKVIVHQSGVVTTSKTLSLCKDMNIRNDEIIHNTSVRLID